MRSLTKGVVSVFLIFSPEFWPQRDLENGHEDLLWLSKWMVSHVRTQWVAVWEQERSPGRSWPLLLPAGLGEGELCKEFPALNHDANNHSSAGSSPGHCP